MVTRIGGWLLLAAVVANAGCISAVTSHHEHAFPEHKKWSIGWGIEAGRNYEDVWSEEEEDTAPVIPSEPLSFTYAPKPELKVGLGMIGTGLGLHGKTVLGQEGNWAGALVGLVGFVNGDDSDPWDNVPTWKATGLLAEASAVLSAGNERPASPGKKDILFAVSAGPKLVYCYLSYEQLNSGDTWKGSVVDYGAFVGFALERWFFRVTGELSFLRVDRPSRGTRDIVPNGGVKLHFSW